MDVKDVEFVNKYIKKNYGHLLDVDLDEWVKELMDTGRSNNPMSAISHIVATLRMGQTNISITLADKLDFNPREVRPVVAEYFKEVDAKIEVYKTMLNDTPGWQIDTR